MFVILREIMSSERQKLGKIKTLNMLFWLTQEDKCSDLLLTILLTIDSPADPPQKCVARYSVS